MTSSCLPQDHPKWPPPIASCDGKQDSDNKVVGPPYLWRKHQKKNRPRHQVSQLLKINAQSARTGRIKGTNIPSVTCVNGDVLAHPLPPLGEKMSQACECRVASSLSTRLLLLGGPAYISEPAPVTRISIHFFFWPFLTLFIRPQRTNPNSNFQLQVRIRSVPLSPD